jgi:hypothetical protein
MATNGVVPLLSAALLLTSLEVRAATFVVNDTADVPDATPGDAVCETAAGNDTCTLRAAIMEANALPGADVVTLPAGTYALALPFAAVDTEANGDLDVTDTLDLAGAGAVATVIEGDLLALVEQPYRVLEVAAGTTARVSGVTIRYGTAYADGAGIANAGDLTLSDCIVRDNIAGLGPGSYDGGGIANAATGILAVSRCTISDNRANTNGGGIANAGTASVEESAIQENSAVTGGGIANEGTLGVRNSTISGNGARVFVAGLVSYSGSGAGISHHAGHATLEHVTVAGNVVGTGDINGAAGSGAGLGVLLGVTTVGYTLSDTIVSANVGPTGADGDCGTPAPTSLGHNIDGDGTCMLTGPGDLPSTDPGLGPLQDNGGPTFTHAIVPGSPPHDAGDAGACPATDQRGVPRPKDSGCDIGAYESNVPCGDGTLDAGEDCDDGNPAGEDCCSVACEFVAAGISCEDSNVCTDSECDGAGSCVVATNAPGGTPCQMDADPCTIDQCDGAGACANAGNVACPTCKYCDFGNCVGYPLTGCRRPTAAGASRLALRQETLKWRWTRGEETTSDAFGDPTATDDYALCIFESDGSFPRLMHATPIPAGGTCGGEPCWTPLGTPPGARGFRYDDSTGSQLGLESLLLKPGGEGRARILAKSRGAGLGLPPQLDVDPPVTVQLQREDGTCWEARYTTPSVSTDTRFKARSDP